MSGFAVELQDLEETLWDPRTRVDGGVHVANRSSQWRRTPGGWQLEFHQGTPERIGGATAISSA